MYLVSIGPRTLEYETRAEAIDAAKELSLESRRTVIVRDELERERMSYHMGSLDSYTFDTRNKGRRREGDHSG